MPTTVKCGTCEKSFELVPIRLPFGGTILRSNPCFYDETGDLIDFCSKECHSEYPVIKAWYAMSMEDRLAWNERSDVARKRKNGQ